MIVFEQMKIHCIIDLPFRQKYIALNFECVVKTTSITSNATWTRSIDPICDLILFHVSLVVSLCICSLCLCSLITLCLNIKCDSNICNMRFTLNREIQTLQVLSYGLLNNGNRQNRLRSDTWKSFMYVHMLY